ncbi:hypothetical protein PMAYCL1PPCAC_26363 [Pristionchus mayeri]|uniref:Uncharacterized protein n=1 Tax=Pristionchus mayeri TaxID=1317129 RepID=A0AAN5D421_9BILA|nr:hypothetical protein PMAYCL1PPCAC_26363 [Pristionchus mayeri]
MWHVASTRWSSARSSYLPSNRFFSTALSTDFSSRSRREWRRMRRWRRSRWRTRRMRLLRRNCSISSRCSSMEMGVGGTTRSGLQMQHRRRQSDCSAKRLVSPRMSRDWTRY